MGSCCSCNTSDDQVKRKSTNNRNNDERRRRNNNNNYMAVGNHVRTPDRHGKDRKGRKVDLNLAGVQELCTLPGISASIAHNIVDYRNTNGPFKSTRDVSNVRGITGDVFNKIKDRVYVSHQSQSPATRKHQPNQNNGYIMKADFQTLRIATWNLKCFGTNRLSDKNVLDVVCVTILKNKFDFIAFQELADPDVLKSICNELNTPRSQSVKQLHSTVHWKQSTSKKAGRMYQSSEYNGFLWNNFHSLQLRSAGVLGGNTRQDPNDRFVRRPFIGHFEIGSWKFSIVSVHLKATGLDGSDIPQLKHEISMLPTLMQALQDQGHSDIILLGDFNMVSSDSSFDELKRRGFKNLIPASIFTNISGRNLRGGHQYDNVWADRGVSHKHKGVRGVVREGLKINDNETVSDHCPVWVDIKI